MVTTAKPRYTPAAIVRRGQEIYEHDIRDRVEADNIGRVLVLDIVSGEYEIDDDDVVASKRAHAKHPGGVFYAMRIGYPALDKIGGGWGDTTQ